MKYRTHLTEKQFKGMLNYTLVAKVIRWWTAEFVEIVGQAVFSGKQIVFKEEDEMKEVSVDEINAKLTTAAMLDEAEAAEESPFPIPFEELPAQPEWDEWQPGLPPEEEDGGEF